MYKHYLIGKTLQEAVDCITESGQKYKVVPYIATEDWDTELVIRVIFDGVYNLTTSGFKLFVKDVDNE